MDNINVEMTKAVKRPIKVLQYGGLCQWAYSLCRWWYFGLYWQAALIDIYKKYYVTKCGYT